MDAAGGKSRTDVPGFVRRLVFDAAWIAHQQCCFWSALVTNNNEIGDAEMRRREKKGP